MNAPQQALFTAVYSSSSDALADLDAVEQLHKDELIGKFDAAVLDQKDGKPHILKRIDRPRMEIIPEAFGGGKLPRKELKDAASELTSSEAALVVVGDVTIEKAVSDAIARTDKVVKRELAATTDEIADELRSALGSSSAS